jgi:hypothetical protein
VLADSRPRGARPRVGPLIAGLFSISFAFYALTGPGYSISGDGSFLLLSARNLLRTGSSSVPAIAGTELSRRRGVDGREYPKFGPGLALAHLPMLVAVSHFEPLQPTIGGRAVSSLERDAFYAPFTNAWLMAATLCGIALSGIALGFRLRGSVALAALVGVASPLWLYARVDSTEALQSATLIGATYFLVRERDTIRVGSAVAAGALLAGAVAAKLLNVIVLPWFLLFAGWKASRSVPSILGCLAAPALVVLGLLAIFNLSRYGSPFGTGYELIEGAFDHPILDGASVQLFSLGHGLLVFCPALLLLPLTAPEFVRRFPAESALAAAVFVSHLAVYSKWWAYWGMSWGPRFLVPALPLLVLMLLPAIEQGAWRRGVLVFASLAGIAVQAIAVTTSYWGQVVPVWQRLAVQRVASAEEDAGKAGIRRWNELVHLTPMSPLRIGLWWLENASCRDDREPKPELTQPPWSTEFPWLDPERAPAELADLPGLDLWAVPECWRRSYTSLWSKEPAPIPSNPRLSWLLLGLGGLGAALVLTAWRRAELARPSADQ